MTDVAVIIPVYQREDFALRAVESVCSQRDCSFELCVIDDGSPTPMPQLEAAVLSRGGEYHRILHGGVSAARNHGVASTSARWIAFLDSDDRWLPGKLSRQLAFHQAQPHLVLSQTEERWIRNGRRVNACDHHQKPNGEFFAQALALCCVSPSAVMLERAVFESAGGFDEALPVCEDYDLWLRLAVSHEVGLVDEILLEKFGGHADQLSHSQPALDRFRIYSLFKVLCAGLCETAQEMMLREALSAKIRILMLGAAKRDNGVFSGILERLLPVAEGEAAHTGAELRDDLQQLLNERVLM